MALADAIHVGVRVLGLTQANPRRLSRPRQLVLGLGQGSGHTPAPTIMSRKGAISPVTTREVTYLSTNIPSMASGS